MTRDPTEPPAPPQDSGGRASQGERNPPALSRVMARAARQADLIEALQTICDGVVDVVGFRVVALNLLNDDGRYEVLAIASSDYDLGDLLGRTFAVEAVDHELSLGVSWGPLWFVPGERASESALDTWVPPIEAGPEPDAWHPNDMLLAPLLDEAGVMNGFLSVDLPVDGRRPDARMRSLLATYASAASRTIRAAFSRGGLAERVWLSDRTRRVMRQTAEAEEPSAMFAAAAPALAEAFRADSVWLYAGDAEHPLLEKYGRRGVSDPTCEHVQAVRRHARTSAGGEPVVVTVDDVAGWARDAMDEAGIHHALLVPIMQPNREDSGAVVMGRTADRPDWSGAERAAAYDVGLDIGRSLTNIRLLEGERRLVERLREADLYRRQVIHAVAHELGGALTGVVGHAELLHDSAAAAPDSPDRLTPAQAASSLQSLSRATARLRDLLADLLLLERVGAQSEAEEGGPAAFVATTVALPPLIEEIAAEHRPSVLAHSLTLTVEVPEEATALADRRALRHVVGNLVSNAVKYSEPGGQVQVRVDAEERHGRRWWRLVVSDDGIGISAEDLPRLTGEFFRSRDPRVRERPGTGLGLAIVHRLVEQFGGELQVRSELDVGTTVTVRLPAAP